MNKKGEKRVNRKARERKASWPRLRMTRHGQNDVLVCNLNLCGRLAWLLSSMIFLMFFVFPGTFFSPIFCLFGFQHSQITFFTSCFSPFSHFLVECCENLWEQGKTHKYAKGLKGFARTQKRTPAYHKHHRLWLWDPQSSENPDPNQWEPVLLLWQTCHPGGLEDAGIKMSCNCVAHPSWMCNPFTEVSLHHFKRKSKSRSLRSDSDPFPCYYFNLFHTNPVYDAQYLL